MLRATHCMFDGDMDQAERSAPSVVEIGQRAESARAMHYCA